MKSKIKLRDVWHYFVGNVRYYLYYSPYLYGLLPKHIEEQVDARVDTMDTQCLEEGQCKMCGCETTKLQFADKACDKPCYPKMLSKKKWQRVKELNVYGETPERAWLFKNNKFIKNELEK